VAASVHNSNAAAAMSVHKSATPASNYRASEHGGSVKGSVAAASQKSGAMSKAQKMDKFIS